MNTAPAAPAASQQAALDAALLVLKSMGLSPDVRGCDHGQDP
jgi:hypothetical protein